MNTFRLKLTAAVIAIGGLLSVMTTSCGKKAASTPDQSIRHSNTTTANARIFIPGTTRPGGLWYLGTPFMGNCQQPCGNFCHAEPWPANFMLDDQIQEFGPVYYTLVNNQLVAEIDMTNVNPQHIDEITANGTFGVPVASEIPYQSVVQAYNNAGITSNIPHYKMPQGTHDVALNNTGASVKVLTVVFTSPSSIEVSLEY